MCSCVILGMFMLLVILVVPFRIFQSTGYSQNNLNIDRFSSVKCTGKVEDLIVVIVVYYFKNYMGLIEN